MAKINLNEIYSDQYLGISEINGNYPDCLYHYTDADALHGILSKEEIWATDNRFMNDNTEFIHGIGIFENILRSFEDSSSISKATINVMNRLSNDNFIGVMSSALRLLKREYLVDNDHFDESIDDEYRKMFIDRSRYYVVCFTEKNDDLSQWRGYGASGGGYSVGFKISYDKLKESKNQLFRVIYDEQIKIELAKKLILNIKNFYDEYLECDGVGVNFILSLASYAIEKLCLHFKDKSFSDEKEWRLVYVFRNFNHEFNLKCPKNEMMFRIKNSNIIPYIPIKFSDLSCEKKYLIAKLICGPSANINFSVIALNQLRDKFGYEFNISKSEIPFRST